jgi:Family of unknown function (DUF5677)
MPDLLPPPVPDGGADHLRLYTCQRYLRWSIGCFHSSQTRGVLNGADAIMLSIFARSTRTYEAVVRWLGERCFSEQGLMLNRSLFEDMVDIHWVSLNPALAVERYEQHDKYSRLLRADVQRRWPDMFDGRKPPKIKVTNDDRKELKRLYGAGGSRSWTGQPNTEDRLKSILVCWPTDSDRRVVEFWHDWVQKLNNETLHLSALSMGRLVKPAINDDESTVEWRFGSTPEWLPQALHGAVWTYAQTVGLVAPRFTTTTEEDCSREFERVMRDFTQASHWERTGRLDSLLSPGGEPRVA